MKIILASEENWQNLLAKTFDEKEINEQEEVKIEELKEGKA